MAEAGVFLDQISCSVCLDTLKDPVTIPCGHSYCLGCIKSCWDQDDNIGIYSCPQCRETFTPRLVLHRNTMLAEVVERLKKTGLNTPPPPPVHSPAGPGDVLCDFCTEEKTRAVKSCLVCLASYCQSHLQPHYEVAPLKKHKLVDATRRLDDVLCPNHRKLLEVYCCTDQKCICLLCVMDDHKGHDTVSAAAESAEKQKQLGKTRGQYQQRLEQREKELKTLRQAVESLKSSAQTAVQDSERIFTELIRSIDRRRCEVTQMIRAQETAAVSQAGGLMERLEQEIVDLKTRDADLKQLSLTEDHVHFLQKCQSLCAPPGAADSPNITVSPLFSLEAVGKAVIEMKERLEDVCQGELVKISQTVKRVSSLQDPELRTRAEFHTSQYCIYGDVMMIDTTGASEETAKQDHLTVNGVSASCKMAEQDLSRLNDYKDIIVRVGKRKQMDPAVISAIISRQSRAGAVLKNGWGDCENAFGLMQVNKLYYTPEGEWNSEEHVAQGTQILIDFIIRIKRTFPNWPKEHWFKGGIAAYCAGDGNVESYEKVDDHTTGKDFANYVVARAQWYKKNGF